METQWSQKEEEAKDCSVVEMYMLSEDHMLGLKLKAKNV